MTKHPSLAILTSGGKDVLYSAKSDAQEKQGDRTHAVLLLNTKKISAMTVRYWSCRPFACGRVAQLTRRRVHITGTLVQFSTARHNLSRRGLLLFSATKTDYSHSSGTQRLKHRSIRVSLTSRDGQSASNCAIIKAIPHNSSARLTMPFPPSGKTI